MLIQETFVDTDRNARFGETEPYEAFTSDVGKLYRLLRREYGACVSRVYITTKTEDGVPVGWVFRKRMHYDDCAGCSGRDAKHSTYIREVWVTLYDAPDEVQRTHHYLRTDSRKPVMQ